MSDATAPAPVSVATVASTELIKNLLLGAQATTAAITAIGAQYDLTVDEWLILDGLDSSDGATMSEVSVSTLASGASLTRAVDRLVTRSLVYRTPSATDRRKVEVRISDLGRDLHAQMRRQVSELETSLRSALDVAGTDQLTAALGEL
ncbi:MarR family transcriptional regulator [Gordonia sp. (in: high G+C Gram-positive bacteria)]|uniref:MarR family winged helix-turn-helix transcriptional regulator n=1 Tax=Gordonia sp. (in: high G+C Gram-positive bacteria) TaxID=84139 RepID=UPI0016B96289|nr:MarR family transcriptional regulator [Gordonia sp. (in: high G+C Gram-positive bacteria)]NLG45709.1 MarR family transcriptional regulator [Gordonia sp. (in: high G+C Gram-positive bacteria)]